MHLRFLRMSGFSAIEASATHRLHALSIGEERFHLHRLELSLNALTMREADT